MHINIALNIFLLILLVLAALWATMTRSLLRSAVGLACVSAILTVIMFELNAPLAGVFELSVCTGLITVVFISTVSLTQPLTRQEIIKYTKERLTRFWYLPFIIVAAGILLSLIHITLPQSLPPVEIEHDVRYVLWNLRPLDLIGQIIMLLAGTFGVVVLFKEIYKK
ncbi:MAG: hypothetical protein PHG69_02550 [Candidatus Omnitrophica bacterium]|nr:hypothetical protein [Candidatus Omnitrophota bacterium]